MVEQRIEEITRANLAFYAAFESLDMLQMDKVWAHLEYVTCIHPGWSLRSDWPAVRDSWVLIFNNTFSMKFELSDVQVQVAGDLGVFFSYYLRIQRIGYYKLNSYKFISIVPEYPEVQIFQRKDIFKHLISS